MRKIFYSLSLLLAAGSMALTASATEVATTNLMAGAFTGLSGGDGLNGSETWIAWNPSSLTTNNGDGWNVRNHDGGSGGAAEQIFFRWNSDNNNTVYAYKVELKENHRYLLTFDATTNDGKANNILVGFTDDLNNVTSAAELPNMSSFSLNGHNSDVLWTNPAKVRCFYTATKTGYNYILFSGTTKTGNMIIRGANFSLTERPSVLVTVDGKTLPEVIAQGSIINVTPMTLEGEDMTVYYSINGAEPVEYTGTEGIKAENPGSVRIYGVVDSSVTGELTRVSEKVAYVVKSTTDLMPVIEGETGMTTPQEPWFAYNTETKSQDQAGDGWNYRNHEGTQTGGAAEQLFLRWNTINSPWVYGYKIKNLEADNTYLLTLDCADNNNRGQVLLIGLTDNLDNVTNPNSLPDETSYALIGHDAKVLWTNPVKVRRQLEITGENEYYILFASRSTPNNDDIIRLANINLYLMDTLDYQDSFTTLQAEVETFLSNIEEDGYELFGADETAALKAALKVEGETPDYKTAYISLRQAYSDFQDAWPTYRNIKDLRNEVELYMTNNAELLKYATSATSDALTTAVETHYTTVAEAAAAVTTLTNAWRAAVESAAVVGSEPTAVKQTLSDWTAEFDILSAQYATLADGTQVTNYYDSYNQAAKTATQTATLAKGFYRYAIFARASENVEEFTLTVTVPAAEEPEAPLTRAGEDEEENNGSIVLNQTGNQGNVFGNGWAINIADFEVPADNTEVTFTINGNSTGNQWYGFMNPTLYSIPNVETAVSEIEAPAAAEAVYYTINGMKVTGKLVPGIYVKVANGKAQKVLVK